MTNYQRIFQLVFGKLGFAVTKTFREGPRFYVIGGVYHPPGVDKGEKAIFKADLEAEAKRLPKARLRLRREAIFLRHAKFKYAPRFYSRGTHVKSDVTSDHVASRGIFWLLEEWVPGKSQESGESAFLIRNSFFTEQNLKHSLNFLKELHRLTQISKPGGFGKPRGLVEVFEKHLNRYNLADYVYLMRIDRPIILGKRLAAKVDAFVNGCHRLFNRNQTVITHHELYGPHIFISKDSFKLIDWENVGWGNPAHDFVELWMRSFAHQDFQREFYERFRASQEEKRIFDELFRLEVILQGIGNLSFFKSPDLPEEKKVAKEASAFLKEEIERAVVGKGLRIRTQRRTPS